MVRCALLLAGMISAAALGATSAGAEVLIGLAAPLAGRTGWIGEPTQKGVEKAVADLNAQGGVLGERLEIITVDDNCEGEQAVAAARKLIDAGVVFVVGHPCSGAAIPASDVYEAAGVLLISSTATALELTERGLRAVFRVIGRDDVQGRIASDFLVEHVGERRLAILHDNEVYGRGLAEETKRCINERGITEVMFEAIEPGKVDYSDVVQRLQAAGVEVLYYGGYAPEAALILRQARDRDDDIRLVSGDSLTVEDFWLIAGSAGEGALFTGRPDPRDNPEAAPLHAALVAENYDPPRATFGAYGAVLSWAQAVEQARTFEARAVAEALHTGEFDTVLGRIGFDEKGDVTGSQGTFVWYAWSRGNHVPLDRRWIRR